MDAQTVALMAAGIIGGATAVIHGVLTQKLMVRPFETLAVADGRMSPVIRRIVPLRNGNSHVGQSRGPQFHGAG